MNKISILIMKNFKIKNQICLIILLAIIVYSCTDGRYTTDFKRQSNRIDTMTFFRPSVQIQTYKGTDSSIINFDCNQITSVIYGILFKKHKLVKYDYKDIDFGEIYLRLKDIDKTKGPICNVSIKNFIDKLDKKIGSRYALIILYYGLYNPDFEPDYNIKFAMTYNAIPINSPASVNAFIIAVVIDSFSKEIVYYNRISSSNSDPRKGEDVRGIAQNLLQWFY